MANQADKKIIPSWEEFTAPKNVPSWSDQEYLDGIKMTPGGTSLVETKFSDIIKNRADRGEEFDKEVLREQVESVADKTTNLIKGTPFLDTLTVKEPELSGVLDTDMDSAYRQMLEQESIRIENVLKEKVDNYAGANNQGPLTFMQTDKLFRYEPGKEREEIFKKMFPEGKLFSAKVGENTFVDLYQTSPNGRVHRVSDEVLSLGDLGKFTGSIANFKTAGSLIGSMFMPFWGTAGGFIVGDLVDDTIKNLNLKTKDALQLLAEGDRYLYGVLEATIAKFFPGLVNGLKRTVKKMSGTDPGGSWLYTLGLQRPQTNAILGQQAAIDLSKEYGVELPMLSGAQLSNSLIFRGTAAQVSGTSDQLPKYLSKQKQKLFELMNKKYEEGGNFNSFTEKELMNYINLSYGEIKDNVLKAFFKDANIQDGIVVTKSLGEAGEALLESSNKAIKGLNAQTEKLYTKAFDASDLNSVTFNIKDIKLLAREVTQPVKGKGIQKDEFVDIAGIDKRLENVATDVLRLDDIIDTVQVGAKATRSSFAQIKTLRDRVADLAYDDTLDRESRNRAVQFLASFDDLIVNGVKNGKVTGGKNFLKYYTEAGELFNQSKIARNMGGLGQLFRTNDMLPETMARSVINGTVNKEQLDLFVDIITRFGKGKKNITNATKIRKDISEFAILDLMSDPSLAAKKLDDLKAKPGLLNTLFPDPAVKTQLTKFVLASKQLQNDAVQRALADKNSTGLAALNYVRDAINKGAGDLAVADWVRLNGGLDGPAATEARAALFRDILGRVTTTADEFNIGGDLIDPAKLTKELTDLASALKNKASGNDYAPIKALFGTVNKAGQVNVNPKYLKTITDLQSYSGFLSIRTDVGGPMQAGSVRAQITNILDTAGVLKGYQTLVTNSILARIMAKPPSVEQLKIALDSKGAKRLSVMTQLIQRIINGLDTIEEDDGTYQIKDLTTMPTNTSENTTGVGQTQQQTTNKELSVTTQPPINQVSQATLPFDRRTTVPPPAQQTGKGITNFASLFANDPIGEAIANRRLTQGIGSIG